MSEDYQYTIAAFIEGLQIIFKDRMDNKWAIRGEHDVIYCGGDWVYTESDDGRRLLDLGFYWDDDAENWTRNT